MSKKVIIIGAGIAGLSAGINLRNEGIDSEIFELAPRVGGTCAAWSRSGYRFDCLGWLMGTKKGDPLYQILREAGALKDDTEIFRAKAVHIEIDDILYEVPMDILQFKNFLLALSWQDSRLIEEFCRDIELMMHASVMPDRLPRYSGIAGFLKRGSACSTVSRKYVDMTVREVSARFQNPLIAKILSRMIPGEYSAFPFMTTLGGRMAGNAGYPLGGAAGVVGRMAEKYFSLGGKINLGAKVDEIVIASGAAAGIRSCGELFPADGVIAACDAHETIENLLRSRYGHPPLEALLKNSPIFEPLAIVSFGLDRQFGIPYALTCECPEGFNVAPGVRRRGYALRSFDFDPSAAPPGGSSVMAMFEAPLEYWQALRSIKPESYKIQKELLADLIASKIEKRYPGFKDAVSIVDIATPATFSRLTNVYRGSFEGIAPTPGALRTKITKTFPGLRRFCVCGQWTIPGGGIGAAAADGKTAARIIKKGM